MLCFLKNPVYHKLTPPKKLWLQAHPTAYSQASLAGALRGPGLETPTGRVLQQNQALYFLHHFQGSLVQ